MFDLDSMDLEDKEEFVPEENDAVGIAVDDGDDMSPIIMDGHEEIIISEEEIDKVLEMLEEEK